MRKLKQLCRDFRTYETLHIGKILIAALQRQIHRKPNGTQVRYIKKCAKSYFRENYPAAFDEMQEKDWDDVAKRLSCIWNTTKNEDPIFADFRVSNPSYFGRSAQVSEEQIKLPFDIYEEVVLPVEKRAPIPQPAYAFKADTTVTQSPPTEEAFSVVDRIIDRFTEATVTTKDGTVIQLKK